MQAHQREFRVTRMSQVLQVSRSGFYAWQHQAASPRAQANEALIVRMRVLHQQTREAYGARKMWQLLKRDGLVLKPRPAFGHGVAHRLPNGQMLFGCYHPSRQNTNTGKLTAKMLDDVFREARGVLEVQGVREVQKVREVQ